jgi:hypothetical protein
MGMVDRSSKSLRSFWIAGSFIFSFVSICVGIAAARGILVVMRCAATAAR